MKTSRKNFIKTGALLALGSIGNSPIINAAVTKVLHLNNSFPFKLPDLGYAYNYLEPHIDAQTMEIHHTKHHQAYINKLNEIIEKNQELKGQTLETLLGSLSTVNTSAKTMVRNHGGGHYNHTFFWSILKPNTKPSEKTTQMLNSHFGSVADFKTQFEKAAMQQFGSGWAWLIKTNDGKLQITSTPNQDNPIMDLAPVKGKPIVALDVWEHAYYLKYQNKRADYVKAFWEVLNWQKVESLLFE